MLELASTAAVPLGDGAFTPTQKGKCPHLEHTKQDRS